MPTYSPQRRYAMAVDRIGRAETEARAAYAARDQAVADIYDRGGYSYKSLAAELGLSVSRVQQIVEAARGRTMRHRLDPKPTAKFSKGSLS
jgi:transposase